MTKYKIMAMTKYWEGQMQHAPTKLYYEHLTQMLKFVAEKREIKKVFEIGTGWGISGSVFVEAGVDQLFSIDPNLNTPMVEAGRVEILSKLPRGKFAYFLPIKSSEVVIGERGLDEGSFDLVFIDGRHDFINVLNDLSLAKRLIKPDGVIICDDYSHSKNGGEYGVEQAVTEFLELEAEKTKDRAFTVKVDLNGNGLCAIIYER